MVIPPGHIPCCHYFVIVHVTILVTSLVMFLVHNFDPHIVDIFTLTLCIFYTIFLVDFSSHILGHIFVGLLFILLVTFHPIVLVMFPKAQGPPGRLTGTRSRSLFMPRHYFGFLRCRWWREPGSTFEKPKLD